MISKLRLIKDLNVDVYMKSGRPGEDFRRRASRSIGNSCRLSARRAGGAVGACEAEAFERAAVIVSILRSARPFFVPAHFGTY